MKAYFSVLRRCPLFQEIEDKNLVAMFGCLDAQEMGYKKGEVILAEGTPAKYLGIVLTGKAQVERVDYYGNRSILTNVDPAQIFGESFACAGLGSLPINVLAVEDTKVLLIDAQRITQSCSNACDFHNQIIFNLLNIVARKSLVLHRKIEITSHRTTREKLMAYLLMAAKDSANNTFTIPYDRQQLADYLEVERSGLSAEISKLRKEKILECHRSTFTLLLP